MNVKLCINTYKLNDVDDLQLRDFYTQNNLLHITIHDKLFPSECDLLNNTYDTVNNILTTNEFKFIVFVRIDLYLKPYCIETISFDPDYIQFAHIDSNIKLQTNPPASIGICQQIMLYPHKFFSVIRDKIIYNATHKIRDQLIKYIPNTSIRYFVNTLHVCSTDLGWNPLYIQVGRHNKIEYHSGCAYSSFIDHYYDIEKNLFIKDSSATTDYWETQLEKDRHEDPTF
jgi:hypothetical protein